MTVDELIAFEDDIAAEFAAGNIKAPVHLSGGNEAELLEAFKSIAPEDWVFCTWRSHYHCLLNGVPPAEVKAAIMAGRSIALCFPEYRILSSAIVGGICPIAMGMAWAIKHRGGEENVWAFVGDMAAETGVFDECQRYSRNFNLPVNWIVEDNDIGGSHVATSKVWGSDSLWDRTDEFYEYRLTRPFVGIGKHIPL